MKLSSTEIIKDILSNPNIGPLFVATNSRVNGLFLNQISDALNLPVETVNRQRKRIGKMEIFDINNSDVAFMVSEIGGVGFTTIDALFTYALIKGFNPPAQINDFLEISPLGFGKCNIEIACTPKRTDIITCFENGGLKELKEYITKNDLGIVSDKPELAKYYFPMAKIRMLKGKTETLAKLLEEPLIVGIVETGNSLSEENWVRLSLKSPKAILLKSQTCVIRRRNDQR